MSAPFLSRTRPHLLQINAARDHPPSLAISVCLSVPRVLVFCTTTTTHAPLRLYICVLSLWTSRLRTLKGFSAATSFTLFFSSFFGWTCIPVPVFFIYICFSCFNFLYLLVCFSGICSFVFYFVFWFHFLLGRICIPCLTYFFFPSCIAEGLIWSAWWRLRLGSEFVVVAVRCWGRGLDWRAGISTVSHHLGNLSDLTPEGEPQGLESVDNFDLWGTWL